MSAGGGTSSLGVVAAWAITSAGAAASRDERVGGESEEASGDQ